MYIRTQRALAVGVSVTQEDYDAVMLIIDIWNAIPEEYNVQTYENDKHTITFNFDGSGKSNMTIE